MLLTYSSVCEGEGGLALVTLRALYIVRGNHITHRKRKKHFLRFKWLGLAATQTQLISINDSTLPSKHYTVLHMV